MKVASWGGSRMGSGRNENQDAWGQDPERGLYVLCDGMGGHAGGAEAASVAVQSVLSRDDPEATRANSDLLDISRRAQTAHRLVKERAASLGQRDNMGATLAVLWLKPDKYLLACVGDSRAYLWRGGQLAQLSEDHTVVQSYVNRGLISQTEAESHPQRHMLQQALGVGHVEPDLFEAEARAGDVFLLASDGLYEVVGRERIALVLAKANSLEKSGRALLALVERQLGDDDATVLLVGVE